MAGSTSSKPKTKKFNGKTYKLHSCKAPKTTAAKLRKSGYRARVVGDCVYKGPKMKKKTSAVGKSRRRRRA